MWIRNGLTTLILLNFNLYQLCSQCLFNRSDTNTILFETIYRNDLPEKYQNWSNRIDSLVSFLSNKYNIISEIHYLNNCNLAEARFSEGSICIGLELMDEFIDLEGGFRKFSFIIAHEFSHLIQFKRIKENGPDVFWLFSKKSMKPIELQADFIASYLLCHHSIVNVSYYSDLYQVASKLGDYDFFEQTHHGTPKERWVAVVNGQQQCTNEKIDDVFEISYLKIKPSLTMLHGIPELIGKLDISNLPIIYLNSDNELITVDESEGYRLIGSVMNINDSLKSFLIDLCLEYPRIKVQLIVKSGRVYDSKNNFIGSYTLIDKSEFIKNRR